MFSEIRSRKGLQTDGDTLNFDFAHFNPWLFVPFVHLILCWDFWISQYLWFGLLHFVVRKSLFLVPCAQPYFYLTDRNFKILKNHVSVPIKGRPELPVNWY